MGYPVRLIGGTDNLDLPGDPRTYHIGDSIYDLSDDQRTNLQMSGVRFEAIHEDTSSVLPEPDPPVLIPPDQAAVNAEIAAAKKTAVTTSKKEA